MSGLTELDAITLDDIEYESQNLDLDPRDYLPDTDELEEPLADLDDDYECHPWILPRDTTPMPREIELENCNIGNITIRPNNVVELKDHTEWASNKPHSGDFLLVRSIVENWRTEGIVLRGFRLRRTSYSQIFDRKFNDLYMIVKTKVDDPRPHWIQALEDIDPDEVVSIRQCTFTTLNHENMNFRHGGRIPKRIKDRTEAWKAWLFQKGQLVCRWVQVLEIAHNGRCYEEVARILKSREVKDFANQKGATHQQQHGKNWRRRTESQPLRLSTTHGRSGSIEETQGERYKRMENGRETMRPLTFGDGYCCTGGASEGAENAGMIVKFGLDIDPVAMSAYKKNFPGARHFVMDAHDFHDMAAGRRCEFGCDHLHMSTTCKAFAMCKTREGKNDEANRLTVFTIGAWLKATRPTTFSTEQSYGIVLKQENRPYLDVIINDILAQGYQVRWKILDQAWFGLPQHRLRVITIGAKNGFPLPPFPAPEYGPDGSGLRRYRTIGDSLGNLRTHTDLLSRDKYYGLQSVTSCEKPPYDPYVKLASTITTDGGPNYHPSGRRRFKVRELAELQGFKVQRCFAGPKTAAIQQIGDSWGPAANEPFFRTIAAHHEAVYLGLLDKDDEVLDLRECLESKGFDFPDVDPIDVDAYDGASEQQEHHFRYLHKVKKTVKPKISLERHLFKWDNPQPLPAQERQTPPLQTSRKRYRDADSDSELELIDLTKRSRRLHVDSDSGSDVTSANSSPSLTRKPRTKLCTLSDGSTVDLPIEDSDDEFA